MFGGETRRHSSRPPMRGGPRGPGGRGEVDPDKPPMNDQLLRLVPNEVRVVISNPESGDDMAGVMPTKAALEKAREMGTCKWIIELKCVFCMVFWVDYRHC